MSQEALTTQQWQEDLDFLQKTVHTEYPKLFDKITAEEWDALVAEFRGQLPEMESHEAKVGFVRMVSAFKYGHTQVPFSTVAQESVLPVNLYHFEDGIYVEGTLKKDAEILGGRVLKIGEMDIKEALKALYPVVPAENSQYFKGYGMRFLTVPPVLHAQGVTTSLQNDITLTVEKDGKKVTHTLTAVPQEQLSRNYLYTIPNEQWVSARNQEVTPLYLKHLHEKLYFFEYLKDSKTLYVRQSSVFNDEKESLKDFYERMFDFIDTNDVQKLVYDIRLNGGGNNYNNKALIKGLMARPKINTKGKFFYLIGRNTFSAAQNLTNEIENYTEAIIVGEPTAENKNFMGDTRRVTLPNSRINAYLSYAWWQDFPEWENQEYTIPHLAAEMGFEQYINNEDPLLEIALNYTETGFILNPMQHITDLFSQGKMEQLTVDAKKIAKDPAYKYYNFEAEFSKSAYRLFQAGQTEMGLAIYGFVAEVYPESSGVLYNLASSLEQVKQVEKATRAYNTIIELDNNKTLVRTAKKRLAKLAAKKE
jgi:tetratricopeptide (TPR) repeat protein